MSKPKLVIHLDINGTIMPADPIKSQHVRSMLNIHLSKQAFVKTDDQGQTVWWNGCPFQKGEPPPPLLPQYRYKCHIREHYEEDSDSCSSFSVCGVDTIDSPTLPRAENIVDYRNAISSGYGCDDFTHPMSPGHVYEPELLNLMDTLEWKHESSISRQITNTLTLPVDNDRKMNIFVPSFLSLVEWLHKKEQLDDLDERKFFKGFVIVIRTFGSDIPRLIPAFKLIARGQHPDLPIQGCLKEPSWYGTLAEYRTKEKTQHIREHVMELIECEGEKENRKIAVHGSLNIMEFFEHLPSRSVVMVNDDYELWKRHSFSPIYGKPIFVDLDRIHLVRHFLLDDNVNLDPNDSIAAVWLRDEDDNHFKPIPHTPPHHGLAMIGTVLLQANLYKSIINKSAFIDELKKAFNRYTTLRHRLGHSK